MSCLAHANDGNADIETTLRYVHVAHQDVYNEYTAPLRSASGLFAGVLRKPPAPPFLSHQGISLSNLAAIHIYTCRP
jgi:hypothetical protein